MDAQDDILQGKISPQNALKTLTSFVKEYPTRKDTIESLDLLFQVKAKCDQLVFAKEICAVV